MADLAYDNLDCILSGALFNTFQKSSFVYTGKKYNTNIV